MIPTQNDQTIVTAVRDWLINAVLGLNLCPFAHRPFRDNSIEFRVSKASRDEDCLVDLQLAMQWLDSQPQADTLLLILPHHLMNFNEFNQFLDWVDCLLQEGGWIERYQVASFHPHYRFAGSLAKKRENWTNRSPYPILHVLRQEQVSAAIAGHADISQIPRNNVRVMRQLDDQDMVRIFADRFGKGG